MAGAQNELSVAERRKLREEQRRQAEAAKTGAAALPEMPLSELAHNPRNARKELENLEELAQTYAESGVLQPVVVIPADVFRVAFPEEAAAVEGARFVVIGGNRRLGAARLAGLETLPAHINRQATSREAILVAAATENFARQELKPFEELATIEELKAELGTYDAVAKALGKSPGWVSQRRRLHHLAPEVRQALEQQAEGMTIELARDLGKIKDADRQLQAWKAHQNLAVDRASGPESGKNTTKSSTKKSTPPKQIPEQKASSDQPDAGADPEVKARREACSSAVATYNGDATRLHIVALQSQGDPDEALALASTWLSEVGSGPSALHLPTLHNDEGSERQHRAALALSLAHSELYATRAGSQSTPQVAAYLDWLASHADYQAADAAAALPSPGVPS
ncbi:ParB/RepB/Spo0J family partition protein [Streptomyces sp. ASQP_92]|uniref:ParB/RepB/Spo0J family partition protein n=1 Tax=Streptomyces sp. ASQP_92 TaxID=2979116 RepID=UPI0021C06EF8|nr:ParB/RepB/Spo0J family partition protein [Streptomyces sp. ASQP_92]MCT9094175.1 ParB/RepB/Spo0J family partition protein [Streptomyces sp. ASQP_92]